jgi:uncharacterized repeat protein (TIGR01451 family)
MCKPKLIITRRSVALCASALLGLSTLLLPVQTLEASCAVGEGGTLGVDNLGPVHIGDTITVTTVELANLLTSFQATNFNTFVVFPNNNPVQVMSVTAIPPGTSCQAGGAPFDEVCPGGSDCISFVNTYVVSFADVGKNLSFSRTVGGFTAVCNAAGVPGNIQFEEAGAGAALTGTGGTGTPVGAASLCQTILIPVIFPCISITKECDNPCTAIGQAIFFHGTVTNSGDSSLVNVTVTDTPPPGSTASAITFDAVQPSGRTWDGTLGVGESAVYHGSYTPPDNGGTSLCGPFTDTILASAVDVTGASLDNTSPCINSTTGASTGTRPAVQATCHVQTSPCIGLTKDCFKDGSPGVRTLNAGDTYTVSFVVTNCGNVALQTVVIHDDVLGDIGVLGTLAPGASYTTNRTGIAAPGCGQSVTDHATATGAQVCPQDTVCPSPATVTSPQVQCTITVNPCAPCISVTKEVTCAPATGVAGCDATLTYGPSAEGAAGTNNPAFCYKITVSNPCTGSSAVTITNVTVVDTLIPSVAATFSDAATLTPGASVTHFFGQSYGVGAHTNTVTASGVGPGTSTAPGQVTNAQASATATVVPASVTCQLNLTNESQVNTSPVNGCDVQLAAGTSNAAIQVILTINNTGQADLNVSVIDGSVLTTLVDCGTGASNTPPVVFVPAGQTVVTNIGCVTVSCPGATISAVIQGTAVASTTIPCVFDTLGNVIKTATSSCQNCVNCATPAAPVECRVTGGGTLQPGATDQNCVTVTTTLFDDAQCAGSVLDHISHGGQLGAPFNAHDCGQVLANPCIRGQWQHNRHYQGTGNPKDTIDTAFHTYQANVGPVKGVFDTLECACLGCCSGGEFIGSAVANALCNPTDHKICGPEPRPAPANAIIFSGLGIFQPAACGASGKNQPLRWFVFRVYIEDRSEPGGLHPGGAKQPADVYCFQAWDTGITVQKHSVASDVVPDFRRCLAADSCAFIESISTSSNTGVPPGTLPSSTVCGMPADINDCGPLYDGNHQIHPGTGATCTTPTPLTFISP